MAFSKTEYLAKRAAMSRTPLGMTRSGTDATESESGYKPLTPEDLAPKPVVQPVVPPPAPTTMGDIGHESAESWATGMAGVQHGLTGFGLGDWTKEEEANRQKAAAEAAQVSPETQKATSQMTYDDTGFHGITPTGLAHEGVKLLSNPVMVAGALGSILTSGLGPVVGGVGMGLMAGTGALAGGGSAAYDVAQQGGDEAAQRKALYGGALVGAATSGTGVFGGGKILGAISGEAKLAELEALRIAAEAAIPGAVEKYSTALLAKTAEDAAYKIATPMTKVGINAAKVARSTAAGALGGAGLGYGMGAGQIAAENIALDKPIGEGANAAGMMSGLLGTFAGGSMAVGAHTLHGAKSLLKSEVAPGTHSTVGEEVKTEQAIVPNMTGRVPTDFDPSKINTAYNKANDTSSIVVGKQGEAAVVANTEGVADKVAEAAKAEKITGDLNAGLHTTSLMDVGTKAATDIPIEGTKSLLKEEPTAKIVPQVERRNQPFTPERQAAFDKAERLLTRVNEMTSKVDPGTIVHQTGVTDVAENLANQLGLTPEQVQRTKVAALGHDIGKRGMEDILGKTTPLTDTEFGVLKTHPDRTAKKMKALGIPEDVIKTAMEHHEQALNVGKGYPAHEGTPDFSSQIVSVADVGDSLIGGPGSGHDYPLRFKERGKNVELPRTTENVIKIMTSMVRRGELNGDIFNHYKELLLSKNLPERQAEQLRINDAKVAAKAESKPFLRAEEVTPLTKAADEKGLAEAETRVRESEQERAARTLEPGVQKMPAPREIPPEGTHVVGADSYYIDAAGKPVGSSKEVLGSTKAGAKDSITLRAVAKLHSLITGVEGKAEHLGDDKYKVGDEIYTLNRRGEDFEVIPDKGLSDTHDVTIEHMADNKLRIRVDDFSKERNTTRDVAKNARILKEGTKDANTLINKDPEGKASAKNTLALFHPEDPTKAAVPVTVSALRKLGATLQGHGNETLAEILDNVKTGLGYAMQHIGEMIPRLSGEETEFARNMRGRDPRANALELTIRNMIVSDKYGPVTTATGRVGREEGLVKAPTPIILADGTEAKGPITFGQAQEILDMGNKGSTRAQNRANAATVLIDGFKLLKSTKQLAIENAQNPRVMALISELQGNRTSNKRLNPVDWLTEVRNNATKAAKNTSGIEEALPGMGEAQRIQDETSIATKETALNAAESIKNMLFKIDKDTSLGELQAMYNELESRAGTDMPAPEGKVIKVRGDKLALHSLDTLRNLMGDMRKDPSINPLKWMRARLDEATKAAAGVSGREESTIDDVSAQVYEPSEKDVWTESPKQSLVKPVERVLPYQQLEMAATTALFTPKVNAFLDGLTAKLGILTSFSLHDSASIDSMPQVAKDLVSQYPHNSVFIALDDGTGKNQHIIYIAQTNTDGTPRSKKAQAIDLAHEYGHFVQRTALDFIVNSAKAEGADPRAKALLADILGVPYEEGRDPMAAFEALTHSEKGMVDEMFANNLAQAILAAKKGSATEVEGTTFLDAVSAPDKASFINALGKLIAQLWVKFSATLKKVTPEEFDRFLEAMTNRTKVLKYSELAAMQPKNVLIPSRTKGVVQYMADPMQRASQWDKLNKLMSSRTRETILENIHHFYSTDSELRNMGGEAATWLARNLSAKTGDVGSHKEDYLERVRSYRGKLQKLDTPVLRAQPKYDYLIGSDPAADAFRQQVASYQIQRVPTEDIPANLNYTVRETMDGRKNVVVNVRDNVAMLRKYDDALHAFETAEGANINKQENHFAFILRREAILNDPEGFKAQLMYNGPVDMGAGKVEQHVGWDERSAENFVNFYRNGKNIDLNPFANAEGIDDGAKARDTFGIALFDSIAGSTHDSTKSQKLTEAEHRLLSGFVEVDPATIIAIRSSQAVKARALDHMFGSWVIPGANKNDYVLLTREQNTAFVHQQHSLAGDAIVKMWGYPDVTDAKINDLFRSGDKQAAYAAQNTRKAIIEDVKNTDNLDPQYLRGREILQGATDFIARSFYSPMAKVDAMLQSAENSGGLTQRQVIRIQDVIMPAVMGRLGAKEMGAEWRAVNSYLMTFMNTVYLPIAVLSSLAEPVQIGIRISDPILGKGMWASQGNMLKNIGKLIIGEDGKVNTAEADTFTRARGLVMDSAMENAMSSITESQFMSAGIKKFNAKFFEVTMLKHFTDFTRRLAYMCAKDAVLDYAKIAASGDPMKSEQAKAMAKVLNLDIEKANSLSEKEWLDTENAQSALSAWMEEATLRPGANTRPARASDARVALLWYLKDFPWAMQAKTLTYLAQQSKLQPTVLAKMAPWMAAAVPMMIAGALGGYARDLLTNQLPSAIMGIEPTDRYANSWNNMTAAATKSGLMGPYELIFQVMQDSSRRGNMFTSLGGPVASILQSWSQKGGAATAANMIPGLAMLAKAPKQYIQEKTGLRQPGG